MMGWDLVQRAWVGETESRGTKVGEGEITIKKDPSLAQDLDLGIEI